MLILLHSFIYIVGNYTSSINPNPNIIPALLFLGSLAPICTHLASCKISVLNWWQSLFDWLIFVPFVKLPKLSKFSIIMWIQLSGFLGGVFPYAGLLQKSPICWEIWFLVHFLCKKIWYTDALSWEKLLQSSAFWLSLYVTEINCQEASVCVCIHKRTWYLCQVVQVVPGIWKWPQRQPSNFHDGNDGSKRRYDCGSTCHGFGPYLSLCACGQWQGWSKIVNW